MPRLLVLCLLRRRRRVAHSGRRLAHSAHGRSPQLASSDVAVGLVVIFMTFLTPCGYMLSNLNQFRRD
uniref:Cytochrome c oxidase subunit 8 n=1 Tax=Rhinolophus ferrumequinum TaxID=59479 RepID=A0A671E7J8_RHIFE